MKKYLDRSMSFDEYIELIDVLLKDGKTTGPNQSEAMVNYGKLNRQRMRRLKKTVTLNESLASAARQTSRPMIWLIVTEGWCGDAAQSVPVIEKIAAENPHISTRYVLRDENVELIDEYLTNGGRSIPKLIALDANTLEEIWNWGPRPAPAMDYFAQMRGQGIEKPVISENIQRWYLKNKEKSLMTEFEDFLTDLDSDKSKFAKAA